MKLHFFLLFVAGMVEGVRAQGFITDQSLQPPANPGGGDQQYYYSAMFQPLVSQTGQEFTPALPALNFVDVNLFNSGQPSVGTFQIAIHEETISGPVIGLSDQVVRSDGHTQQDTQFLFPSTISLVAGDLYVLEVIQLAGDSGWAIEVPVSASVNGQSVDMNYPGGRLIYGGVPQDNEDMIFQEGMAAVPEPDATLLYALGTMGLCLVRTKNCGRKYLA